MMNYKIAIELLELDNNFTNKELRKTYLKKCLTYHPDKSTNKNSKYMFQRIHEAYEYLQNNSHSVNKSDMNDINDKKNVNINVKYDTYIDVFKNFVYSMKTDFLNSDEMEHIMNLIIKVTNTVLEHKDDVALKILEKLDEDTCNKIYHFINNYKHIFNITSSFLIKLRESINKRFETLPTIILKPELSDLLNANIFIYDDNNSENDDIYDSKSTNNIKYYIPLWHHELYFKHHIINIHPQIPMNIQIDSDNNIIVSKHIKSQDLLNNENIEVHIEDRLFIVHRSEIKLLDYQRINIKNSGIPKINEKDIYDISKKSDIILMLYIEF